MSELSELDRPAVAWRYDKWDKNLTFFPLSARQVVDMQAGFADLDGEAADSEKALRFYSELLSLSLQSPSCSADEWLADATLETVIDLGMQAARVSGLIAEEAKKK